MVINKIGIPIQLGVKDEKVNKLNLSINYYGPQPKLEYVLPPSWFERLVTRRRNR